MPDSQALDCLEAVQTLVNTNKSVIKTVTSEYMDLGAIQEEMSIVPANYPKAFIIIGAEEFPIDNPIGKVMRMRLPMWIDIYLKAGANLQSEREAAIKEARDIIENPANSVIAGQHRLHTQELIVERLITYTTDNPNEIVVGAASLQFAVDYSYTRGAS